MKLKNTFFILSCIISAAVIFILPKVSFSEMMESEKPVVAKKPASAKAPKLERIEARIKELDSKLDLTLDQKAKIREILNNVKQETANLVTEVAAKAKKLREKGDSEIEAVLTKEQRNIFNNAPREKEEEEEDEMLRIFK